MGVENLMSFVKNATIKTQISRTTLPNSTAAVDISHWIYRASYSCPEALYHREQVHHAYKAIINYINDRVEVLLQHNVEIWFVFDGMKLPAKQVTHLERSQRKKEARMMVEKMLANNNKSEARKYMLKCLEAKFDVVQQVIEYCKRKNIKYIVAPYEADAQLAYLTRINLCEHVITEDTDLILYGCDKIIYKLDTNGDCTLYQKSRLPKCFGPHGDEVSFDKFRRICILSGCDYLKNIPFIGLQSAKKFFLLTRQDNIRLLLPKLPSYLKSPRLAGKVTEEYIKGFIDAENTFKHHIVYDPLREILTPLEPYPRGMSSRDFPLAGKRFHRAIACDFAKGNINIDTLNPETDLDNASDVSDIEDEDEVPLTQELTRPKKLAAAAV